MSTIIAPSILAADLSQLGDQVRQAVDAGADWIHVDVMDGSFVPNITFGPDIVKTVSKVTDLPIDVHLMIVNPERHLQAFADAGANHITVHFETCPHIQRTLQTLREMGVSPGLVINPGTPVTFLRELTLDFDLILLMTVNPGFGGQSFLETMVDKIRRTKALLDATGSEAMIQVDGGISSETIRTCYDAGSTNFVVGSSIFRHPNGIAAGINALWDALEK
ncbi:MAG: ribulose-phosphate 3-epimerase [Anaerolineaceae bacterium]|nr:ribulose-phosphate 3-epimerase [Anaerolineaceae bacterium]